MHAGVMQRLPNTHQINLNLLRRPLQSPREGTHTNPVQTVIDHRPTIQPHSLQLAIAWPDADGHLEDLLLDVRETRLSDVVRVLLHCQEVDTELGEAFFDVFQKVGYGVVRLQCAVVAA